LIDVSAGQTWAEQQPVYGRMFQTPFSDKIRNEARLATMAVGNIYEPDHANSILAAGRADLVALARPHLVDPMWTLRAAAQLDYRDVHVPPQYLGGSAGPQPEAGSGGCGSIEGLAHVCIRPIAETRKSLIQVGAGSIKHPAEPALNDPFVIRPSLGADCTRPSHDSFRQAHRRRGAIGRAPGDGFWQAS
jgi:hypothetical protein